MALAAGMSPRGTANNFLLYSCYQLMMLDDLGPIISGGGGERSRCLDSNPARLHFFLGLYPGNRTLAGGDRHSQGPASPPALRSLLGPAVGYGQERLHGEGQLPSGWPPRDRGEKEPELLGPWGWGKATRWWRDSGRLGLSWELYAPPAPCHGSCRSPGWAL